MSKQTWEEIEQEFEEFEMEEYHWEAVRDSYDTYEVTPELMESLKRNVKFIFEHSGFDWVHWNTSSDGGSIECHHNWGGVGYTFTTIISYDTMGNIKGSFSRVDKRWDTQEEKDNFQADEKRKWREFTERQYGWKYDENGNHLHPMGNYQ